MTKVEIAVPHSDDRIVVVQDPSFNVPHLVRRRQDGTVVWKVLPPEPPNDNWTELSIEDGIVLASTWSCYRLAIDLHTGQELNRTFTK